MRVKALDDRADVEEPAEEGQTFAANARDKALYYARALDAWCLADDSGLAVDALNGAPGVHSARYAAESFPPGADRPARDAANIAKLLAALRDVGDERRTARFVCHVALADERRILLEAEGTLEGVIARRPAGENGFGYDPVFYLPDRGRTVAQLSSAEKNAISHRGKAVRRLAELLGQMLGGCGGCVGSGERME